MGAFLVRAELDRSPLSDRYVAFNQTVSRPLVHISFTS
jgi:hypothetical protein